MLDELDTWERKHFVDGGGEPFLFYVVYGEVDSSIALSSEQYRSEGIPSGIDVMSYSADSDLDVITSFREGYVWDKFVAKNPKYAQQIKDCETCIVIKGTPHESRTLNYLRDTIGLITFMLDHEGCAVFDPQILRWWHPSEWKEGIFNPAAPAPTQHVVILKSEESLSNRYWLHTRGMRKFGRPDISVHNVSLQMEQVVIDLCNALILREAYGSVIPEGERLSFSAFSPEVLVTYHGGLDNLEFNNFYIELTLLDR
ncbi:MAG: hypothetical protein HC851_10765 [Acaryochloris sp. RU_4_1]|nr:hypothetical protein [Acaryochloris sp. RU_4_1]NJR54630.1 hypothetical protein [Acaryochloris sp. CRU_2_0]